MKKILLPFMALLLFASCQKEIATEKVPEEIATASANKKAGKINVCHKTDSPTNPWVTMEINANALPDHLAHGDIVPDTDGDGYTKVNPCGTGAQNDCNDNNAAINPGATEICDNGIDDNCNGQTDENCIPSVTICNQVWMLKNLDVSTYRDGTPIPEVQDAAAWAGLTTGAWCYYANNSANGTTYGKLYNWYAVAGIYDASSLSNPSLRKQLAPTGWHVPTISESWVLINCVGGQLIGGGPLKETGFAHWLSPNTAATNSSGFTALPGGWRYNFNSSGLYGVFSYINTNGFFWSSSEYNVDDALFFQMGYSSTCACVFPPGTEKKRGMTVRCVKD